MFLDVFRCIYIIVLKYVGWEAGFLHFSPRSRDQLKAHVLTYHHQTFATSRQGMCDLPPRPCDYQ